jgi:hypothetical protein
MRTNSSTKVFHPRRSGFVKVEQIKEEPTESMQLAGSGISELSKELGNIVINNAKKKVSKRKYIF